MTTRETAERIAAEIALKVTQPWPHEMVDGGLYDQINHIAALVVDSALQSARREAFEEAAKKIKEIEPHRHQLAAAIRALAQGDGTK